MIRASLHIKDTRNRKAKDKENKTKNLAELIWDCIKKSNISGDDTSTSKNPLQNDTSKKVTVHKHYRHPVLTKMAKSWFLYILE
jgi:hypothetical protein